MKVLAACGHPNDAEVPSFRDEEAKQVATITGAELIWMGSRGVMGTLLPQTEKTD